MLESCPDGATLLTSELKWMWTLSTVWVKTQGVNLSSCLYLLVHPSYLSLNFLQGVFTNTNNKPLPEGFFTLGFFTA
jgi:hypothetical protein